MDAKAAARERFGEAELGLIELSHRIHAHPELGFEEEHAADWMCETMADAGFAVERGVCGMPTAFIARAGSGPLHIAICAEYDCLPGIGHACGHNIIAASSAGAAIAASKVADDAGLTITLLGTPAEEICNAGGKILMLERGGFGGVHAAMMVHPAPVDMSAPQIIAAAMFDVLYTGKEAHASAFPELGINAGDALTVAQTAIGLMRQHIHDSDRIHGIVTKGGEAANIVPAHTSARYMVRAQTLGKLESLIPKVHRCFEAGGRHRDWMQLRDRRRRQTVRRDAARSRPRIDLPSQCGSARPQFHRSRSEDAASYGPSACNGRRFDRHGQRVAATARNPPAHRDQLEPGGQSSAGVHRRLRDSRR
jgi:metal-dependent amidase/aminoacylase/carboxypeptidase family protein